LGSSAPKNRQIGLSSPCALAASTVIVTAKGASAAEAGAIALAARTRTARRR